MIRLGRFAAGGRNAGNKQGAITFPMASNRDDPVSSFRTALLGVLGWALVIFTTTLFGLWLGHSIRSGTLVSLELALGALVMCSFAWLVYPQVAIAIPVAGLAFVLPLKIESSRLRVGAAVANLLAWLCIAVRVQK